MAARIDRHMAEYKVQFEVFEGPLDLLLYLIKKEEVDIYEVNLTRLAAQFIEYVELMRMLDLEIAGEFLVMASTLMYIKSRELLPKEQQAQDLRRGRGRGPALGTDPPIGRIQKIQGRRRPVAGARMGAGTTSSPACPSAPTRPPPPSAPRAEASLFDLINAVSEVLKRLGQREDLREIFEDKWTVSEKIEFLLKLTAEKEPVKFSELFSARHQPGGGGLHVSGAARIDPAQATGLHCSRRTSAKLKSRAPRPRPRRRPAKPTYPEWN